MLALSIKAKMSALESVGTLRTSNLTPKSRIFFQKLKRLFYLQKERCST